MGRWEPADVSARWVPDTRPRIPEVEQAIEKAWNDARQRRGMKLFDGPMCRLERFVAGPRLLLELSPTSYRIFWGTNLNNAKLADAHGDGALANSLGLSCALESADGFLLLGRRTQSLAYYPSRVHTFSGTLEPAKELDLFAEMRRELWEELKLAQSDLAFMRCLGIVEDLSIRQPEMVFHGKSTLSRRQIEANLDAEEHNSVVAVEPREIDAAPADPAMTPVALAATLLWGREHMGSAWFDAAERAVNLGGHEPQ